MEAWGFGEARRGKSPVGSFPWFGTRWIHLWHPPGRLWYFLVVTVGGEGGLFFSLRSLICI